MLRISQKPLLVLNMICFDRLTLLVNRRLLQRNRINRRLWWEESRFLADV